VLPATGELGISYDDGTTGSMSLREAKQLIGAFAVLLALCETLQ
jgi:hypothetical protein